MEQLERALARLNIAAEKETILKFEEYMRLVLRRNETVNLTAITEREAFIKKHFIDAILCAADSEVQAAKRVIDVGTGAGFPGVPLALLFPEKEFVLIDAIDKRVKIVRELCAAVEIPNIAAIHGRAEDLAGDPGYREQFDLCVSRAVAKLSILAEYCLPFVKKGGFFLAYKGAGTEEERLQAENALRILGGGTIEEREASLTGFDLKRALLVIEKTADTPPEYPRKAGVPSKKPL